MRVYFEEIPDFSLDELEVIVRGRESTKQVKELLSHISQYGQSSIEYLPLKTIDRIMMVAIKDIILVEVNGTELTIETIKGRYKIKERLYRFMEKVPHAHFVQISRHAIVNVNHLEYLEDSFSGNMIAFLTHGLKTSVSRKYLKDLLVFLGL